MKLTKQPSDVTLTFSPKDYFLKKVYGMYDCDYMLVKRIYMSQKGKPDQGGLPVLKGGLPVLFITQAEAEVFRSAGFDELV